MRARLFGSTALPVAICLIALAIVIYGYVARATLYTTGDAPRPLSEFHQPYYASWTSPRPAEATVFTEDGDVRFADDRITTLINTPHEERDPIVSPDGSILVFASSRTDGQGGTDLWWSRREGNGYSPPQPLPGNLNTVFNERSPALAPIGGGEYLLAFASNRSFGGILDHDLFVSRGRFGGAWSAPKLLSKLSTGADERSVAMFPTGDAVVFSRPGRSGIEYWESWALPGGDWSEPRLLEALSHPENEHRLVLDSSGMQLLFARGGERLQSHLRLLRPLPKPPYSLTPAWVLFALAVLLLLLRLLALKWRGLEVIYWCLLISLLIHILMWWLLRDEGLQAPIWELEGPEGEGLPPIEFALEMFDQSDREAEVQAAQGDAVREVARAETEPTSSAFDRREFATSAATAPAPAETALTEVAREAPSASATDRESSVARDVTPESEDRFEQATGLALERDVRESTDRDPGSDERAEALTAERRVEFAEARERSADAPPSPKDFDAPVGSIPSESALTASPRPTEPPRAAVVQTPPNESRLEASAAGIRLAGATISETTRAEQRAAPTRSEAVGRRVAEFDATTRGDARGEPNAPESSEVRLTEVASDRPAASDSRARADAASGLEPTKRPSEFGSRSPTLAEARSSKPSRERRAEAASRPAEAAADQAESPSVLARSTSSESARPATATAPSPFTEAVVSTAPSGTPLSTVGAASRRTRSSALPESRVQPNRSGEVASLSSAPRAEVRKRSELSADGAATAIEESKTAGPEFSSPGERTLSRSGALSASPGEVRTTMVATGRPNSASPPPRRARALTPSNRPQPTVRSAAGTTLAASSSSPGGERRALSEARGAEAVEPTTARSEFGTPLERAASSADAFRPDSAEVRATVAATVRPKSTLPPRRGPRSLTPSPRAKSGVSAAVGSSLAAGSPSTRSVNRDEAAVVATAKDGSSSATIAFRPSEGSRVRPSATGSVPTRAPAPSSRLTAVPPSTHERRSRSSFLPQTRRVESRQVAVREVEGQDFGSIPEIESERRERSLVLAPAMVAGRPGLPFPSRSRSPAGLAPVTRAPANLPTIRAKARVAVIAKPRDRTDGVVAWLSARVGAKKQRALDQFGGDERTEAAVARGLAYLSSIQRRDGSWGTRALDKKYGETRIGVTALGLLSFLGAGHYPGSGRAYEGVVEAAIDYLLAQQMRRSGHFGENTAAYSHGIATYALAEAFLLTRDDRLLRPLRRAVRQIVIHQEVDPDEEDYFGGWSYYYHDGHRYDRYPRVSVSVWQVMALKTARLAGIEFEEGHLKAARFYLVNSWSDRLNRFLYNRKPTRIRSQYPTLPGSTPAAVFGLLLLDHDRESEVVQGGVEMILDHRPDSWRQASTADFVRNAKGNGYFMYYSTLALFMHGGEAWFTWNKALKRTLLPSQSDDGSWRPISVYAEYAGDTDEYRAYTTAINVLMLEVYYRYLTPLLERSVREK